MAEIFFDRSFLDPELPPHLNHLPPCFLPQIVLVVVHRSRPFPGGPSETPAHVASFPLPSILRPSFQSTPIRHRPQGRGGLGQQVSAYGGEPWMSENTHEKMGVDFGVAGF
jgi:hypothetical protein